MPDRGQQSLDETWHWLTERRAFDQPLSAFQGLTHPLVEYQAYVSAARLQIGVGTAQIMKNIIARETVPK